jgi:hypothetical protein
MPTVTHNDVETKTNALGVVLGIVLSALCLTTLAVTVILTSTPSSAASPGNNPNRGYCRVIKANLPLQSVNSAALSKFKRAVQRNNWPMAKSALLVAMAPSGKAGKAVESALKGAPPDVKAAEDGLAVFASNFQRITERSNGFKQFEAGIVPLENQPELRSDYAILHAYSTQQCGSRPASP